MKLELVRVSQSNAMYGVLIYEGTPFAVTLERLWQNNEKGKSCIPYGYYTCKRVNSPKFGNTFEVTGVMGRSAILFHKGNIDDDSHGCILVGEMFDNVKGEAGIAASTQGYAQFMEITKDVNEFDLIVRDVRIS